MAVPTTQMAVSYDGNDSAVTPYPVPFPFLMAEHIYAAIQGGVLSDASVVRFYIDSAESFEFSASEISGLTVTWSGPILGQTFYCGVFTTGDIPQGYSSSDGYNSSPEFSTSTWTFVDNVFTYTCAERFEVSFTASGVLAAILSDSTNITYFKVIRTVVLDAPTRALAEGDFTVTRLDDGSGGSLTTTEAVASGSQLVIWRQVPLTQPLVIPTQGLFPAKAMELTLDRLLMISQQLNRRINQLEGVPDSDYVHIPDGTPEEVRDTLTWADATARMAVTPRFSGQLGTQRSDSSLWISYSLAVGAWRRLRDTWQKEWQPLGYSEDVTDSTTFVLGPLIEATVIKEVTAYVLDSLAGGSVKEVGASLYAGAVLVATNFISAAERSDKVTSAIPSTVIPAGTFLTLQVTTTGYGLTARKGLGVAMLCAAL